MLPHVTAGHPLKPCIYPFGRQGNKSLSEYPSGFGRLRPEAPPYSPEATAPARSTRDRASTAARTGANVSRMAR